MNLQTAAQTIKDYIDKANNILLHCHPSPDADSLGSALAMKFALEQIGKKATVIKGDSEMPSFMSSIPGYDTIILKNFFEIDLSEFDLFIIVDAASPNMISRFGKIIFPETLKTVAIDHHSSNEEFAQFNYVNNKAASTTQILFSLFKIWNLKVTEDIAHCLLAGLYTDTGSFMYSLTSKETFLTAAELVEIYPRFQQPMFNLLHAFKNENLKFFGLVLLNIESFLSGKLAISFVTQNKMKEVGITEDDAKNSFGADLIRWSNEFQVCCCLVEHSDKIKLSFRCRDIEKYDLSAIATELAKAKPGNMGGGHRGAAGAVLDMNVEEARKLIVETVSRLYPELGR